MTRHEDLWTQVAAPGTTPARLRRFVARQLTPRGRPTVLLRQAAELERHARVDDPVQLVDRLAGDPGGAAERLADDVARRWAGRAVRACLVGDPAYPARLAVGWPHTGGPPLLAWAGPGTWPDRPAVAIVGARRATGYGTGIAAWLAEAASEAGVLVVSGGALGIDAAAHSAAHAGPGGTAVVLGCGHDVGYPRPHAAPGGLFERVLAHGGPVASELHPGARPTPHHVRQRNRIVAGLADAVVVVEGGARSGSLLTANAAAERGIPVFAVPGDVRAPLSVAPHRLLAEGASPCTRPADLLDALVAVPNTDPRTGGAEETGAATTPSGLPPAVREALAGRWPRPIRVDELAEATRTDVGRLLAALTRARVSGEVADGPDGVRLSRAPTEPRGRRS